MKGSISEIEDALASLGKGLPWDGDLKVSDEFLDPLFRSYFKRLGLPNLMAKKSFYEVAQHVPLDKIKPEIRTVLDAIAAVAHSAPAPATRRSRLDWKRTPGCCSATRRSPHASGSKCRRFNASARARCPLILQPRSRPARPAPCSSSAVPSTSSPTPAAPGYSERRGALSCFFEPARCRNGLSVSNARGGIFGS